MSMKRGLSLWLALAAGLSIVAERSAMAQVSPPPRVHAERLIYDAATDRWIVSRDPTPGTEDGDLNIARQWLAREDYRTARGIVRAWIREYGTAAPRYPEALYIRGTANMGLGEWRAANDDYTELLNDYPGSEFAERALSGRFRIAEQYLAGRRRRAFMGLLRVRDREAGVEIMDDMRINYPDTPLAELAQKHKADYYFARGHFELAEEEYAALATDYPRSRYHPYALLQSARAALASFPGVHFDDVGLVEAQERYSQFLSMYPESAREHGVPVILEQIAVRRADKTYEIAWFYHRTRQPRAARYYYRATIARWPGTPAAAQAQSRLAELGEPVAVEEAEGISRGGSDKGGVSYGEEMERWRDEEMAQEEAGPGIRPSLQLYASPSLAPSSSFSEVDS